MVLSIKKPRFILEPIDLVIVFFYYLFFVLLILSLVGLFKNYYIAGSLIIFLIFLAIFRKNIHGVSAKSIKKALIILVIIVFIFIGCLLFNGQLDGDAINYWLPLSREITRDSAMPNLLLSSSSFLTSRPPFLPLLFAATFSFSGFNGIFVFWAPIIFSVLTLLLLYKWCRWKNLRKDYIFFIFILFLASPLVLSWGWNITQEPLILFFFTAFFYYFEKYKQESSLFNFIFLLFSSVLALASKETALILVIPLIFLLFRKSTLKHLKKVWPVAIFLPMVIWWLRNFLVYDNPVFPALNGWFKGRYSEFVGAHLSYVYQYRLHSIFERFNLAFLAQFLIILPLIIGVFYVFFKQKKYDYIVLLVAMFLIGQFWSGAPGELRYYYPFFGLILIYFLSGLAHMKSRLFQALLIFVSLFGLFSTPIILSKSSFIIVIENQLKFLLGPAQFFHAYKIIIALVLALFFYFVLSKKDRSEYLIILIIACYSIRAASIGISWLNIWLPILVLTLVILGWNLILKLNNKKLGQIVVGVIGILLFLNTWGLSMAYFVANQRFPYPYLEGYTILPVAGEKIKEIEGNSRNFYVLTDQPRYLNWYYDFKEVDASIYTFNYVTKLKYRYSMDSQEVHDLLQEAGIKYIIKSTTKNYWDYFFEKIEDRSELFQPIYKQDSYTLWKII